MAQKMVVKVIGLEQSIYSNHQKLIYLSIQMKSKTNSRLCKSINKVYSLGKDNGSLNLKNKEALNELKFIQKFFKINQQEALILSAFAFNKICGGEDESLCLKDIINWLSLPGIEQVPEIYESITNLIKSDLVIREVSRWEKTEGYYILSNSSYRAILTGDAKFLDTNEVDNFHNLLGKTQSLYNDLRLDMMDGDDFQIKLHGLLEQSFDLPELQWLSKFDLDVNEKQLLIIMAANQLHFPERSVDVERILQRIESRYYHRIAKDIMNGKNILMRENLITFATFEFKTLDEMKLTDEVADHLGLNKSEEDKPRNLEYGHLIFPNEIESKPVFYNKDVESQMDALKKIIDVFQNNKTDENPLRSVKVILTGNSGTGKSQTILNLAKETGSIIYEIDHLLKNPYNGMTEIAYAGMFKEYYRCRKLYSKQGKQVWFVINEFEGLVSRRIAAHHSSDFMVSTATSIFLKETDSSVFKGVLLASCNNFIDHVDPAVARRMTYKIYMIEPDLETRKKIFENRFPFLSVSEIDRTCTHFPLTGANIENIFEQYVLLEKIGAFKEGTPFQHVWDLCQQELSLNTESRKPIGFNQNHN